MPYKVFLNSNDIKFSACHFLKEPDQCSRLHGHNYYVSIEISDRLDDNYFVVDFIELNKKLQTIIKPMDHYILIPTESKDIEITEKNDSIEVRTSGKRYIFPLSDVLFLQLSFFLYRSPLIYHEYIFRHLLLQEYQSFDIQIHKFLLAFDTILRLLCFQILS